MSSRTPLRSRNTPSGKRSHLTKAKKADAVHCALCGSKLSGVPRLASNGLRKLAKTEKRPERIYGGVLCGTCVRTLLKERVRMKAGLVSEQDIDFRHLPYLRSTPVGKRK